jgi:DNA-directed RNA polymerase I and III subunit RPAC2
VTPHSDTRTKTSLRMDHEPYLEIISDPQHPNCATIVFRGEDHTLGNSLRYMLMKNKNVEFAGYSIPHPSGNEMNLRIQTTSIQKPAVEVLKDTLRDLNDLCTHVLLTFREEVRQFTKQNSLQIGEK